MRSEVQLFPDPPLSRVTALDLRSLGRSDGFGAIAQLGERLLCKQEVGGSIPPGSTKTDERNHQCIAEYAVVVFHWKNQSSLKIWEICIDV